MTFPSTTSQLRSSIFSLPLSPSQTACNLSLWPFIYTIKFLSSRNVVLSSRYLISTPPPEKWKCITVLFTLYTYYIYILYCTWWMALHKPRISISSRWTRKKLLTLSSGRRSVDRSSSLFIYWTAGWLTGWSRVTATVMQLGKITEIERDAR